MSKSFLPGQSVDWTRVGLWSLITVSGIIAMILLSTLPWQQIVIYSGLTLAGVFVTSKNNNRSLIIVFIAILFFTIPTIRYEYNQYNRLQKIQQSDNYMIQHRDLESKYTVVQSANNKEKWYTFPSLFQFQLIVVPDEKALSSQVQDAVISHEREHNYRFYWLFMFEGGLLAIFFVITTSLLETFKNSVEGDCVRFTLLILTLIILTALCVPVTAEIVEQTVSYYREYQADHRAACEEGKTAAIQAIQVLSDNERNHDKLSNSPSLQKIIAHLLFTLPSHPKQTDRIEAITSVVKRNC